MEVQLLQQVKMELLQLQINLQLRMRVSVSVVMKHIAHLYRMRFILKPQCTAMILDYIAYMAERLGR